MEIENGTVEALRPKVAVAVFLLKGDKVLLGRRRSAVGYGTFALPGGQLEFGERFEACATREVIEETGLGIDKIEYLTVINNILLVTAKPHHFVFILMRAFLSYTNQALANLEPEKCEGWDLYDWKNLPQPVSDIGKLGSDEL